MPRVRSTTFISVALSYREKDILDEAAKRTGVNRNRMIRNWIESLAEKPKRKGKT